VQADAADPDDVAVATERLRELQAVACGLFPVDFPGSDRKAAIKGDPLESDFGNVAVFVKHFWQAPWSAKVASLRVLIAVPPWIAASH
jgi:hypothetical protein